MAPLRSDDSGVSPTVGTILMVGVVAILASLVTVFALGLGDVERAPIASLEPVRANATALCLRHQGGEPVEMTAARTRIVVNGTEDSDYVAPVSSFRVGLAQVVSNLALDQGARVQLFDVASNQRIAAFEIGRIQSGTLACP